MTTPPENFEPQRAPPPGLWTALITALLLIVVFAFTTAQATMPPGERWAALTMFSILALAYTLQGSIGVYDGLSRIVQADWRPFMVLLGLLPACYISYSLAVDEFYWGDLLVALIFTALPAAAFWLGRGRRQPTLLDAVATLYLWASVSLGLLPALTLPQQGGQVNFFAFASVPLLLLVLAARGWPGLGFSWHLRMRDLAQALLMALLLLLPTALVLATSPMAEPALFLPGALDLFAGAIQSFFYVALPAEILFRGVVQNGLARWFGAIALRRGPAAQVMPLAQQAALAVAALLFALATLATMPGAWGRAALAALAGLGYGWVYQRTGKVTASAVTHALVIWATTIMFV